VDVGDQVIVYDRAGVGMEIEVRVVVVDDVGVTGDCVSVRIAVEDSVGMSCASDTI